MPEKFKCNKDLCQQLALGVVWGHIRAIVFAVFLHTDIKLIHLSLISALSLFTERGVSVT